MVAPFTPSFTYVANPSRVVFGPGRLAELGAELAHLANRRALLLSTAELAERVLRQLALSLPPGLSATSGVNAFAHAVEALYARDANPIISLMAEEGSEQAVELVRQDQYWNPRAPERDALRAMLGRAWAGEPPKPG